MLHVIFHHIYMEAKLFSSSDCGKNYIPASGAFKSYSLFLWFFYKLHLNKSVAAVVLVML